MGERLRQNGDTFGFTIVPVTSKSASSSVKLRHLLVVGLEPKEAFCETRIESFLQDWTSVSIAACYASAEDVALAARMITYLKDKFKDRVNFLRPDLHSQERGWHVSAQKILDNAVCDTIRVKYSPCCISRERLLLPPIAKQFFHQCSEAYTRLSMFHSTDCDGYFAIKDSPTSFFITATKTPKRKLDFDRITRVISYDESSGGRVDGCLRVIVTAITTHEIQFVSQQTLLFFQWFLPWYSREHVWRIVDLSCES